MLHVEVVRLHNESIGYNCINNYKILGLRHYLLNYQQ